MSNETPQRRRLRPARHPGDALVRTGAVVFLIGAVATTATVLPLFLGSAPLPTAAYLVSMLMGVGFALALVGILRSAYSQRRQAEAAAAQSRSAARSRSAM